MVADARLAALDRTALAPLLGREVDLRATLLEHPRAQAFGTRVAAVSRQRRARRGERVLVARAVARALAGRGAARRRARAPRPARRARPVRRLRAPPQRPRRAPASAIRATGRRRGGLLGALDGVRARTERALTAGLPPPQGALARGMVLGQDGALTDDVREDFRVTGLAHLVAASGANVLLLATLVLALATAAGLGLTRAAVARGRARRARTCRSPAPARRSSAPA